MVNGGQFAIEFPLGAQRESGTQTGVMMFLPYRKTSTRLCEGAAYIDLVK